MTPDSATPLRPAAPVRRSGVVVPHQPTRWQRLGAILVVQVVQAIGKTLRWRLTDPYGTFNVGATRPAIFALWHNRLAMCMPAHLRYFRGQKPPTHLAALISASKDGGFLAAILQRFGVQPVRGSSSRRGAQAMLELTSLASQGFDLAITPDGPRGPRYEVQEGVVSLAQITGLPIIPVSLVYSRKIQFKSWDRFQVPFPFARCEAILGQAIFVPSDACEADREKLRSELERVLRTITPD